MSAPAPVVVFTGPTLPHDACTGLPNARLLPPAAQGDLYGAVLQYKPSAIALIDGVFQTAPTVRHKEILWAIDRGVQVYGAASMGALRAAELAGYGMIGIGVVYRWYRRFPMTPDDAVAVAQAPPELGSRALSTALVDLVATYRLARRLGVISSDEARRLSDASAELHYKQRTLAAAIDRVERGHGLMPRPNLSEILTGVFVHQKRQDAKQLIDLLAKGGKRNTQASEHEKEEFSYTDAWIYDLQSSGQENPIESHF